MRQCVRLFMISLQFLSRIPIPVDFHADEKDYAGCMSFFPVVGICIGGLMFAVWKLLSLAGFGMFASAAAVVFQCYITGCFHVDGLSDTCDGIFSSRSQERMLEIMKDSRIGVMGAVAVIADVLLKTLLIAEISAVCAGMYVPFLGMMAFAKVSSVGAAWLGTSARQDGLGKHFMDSVGAKQYIFAFLSGGIVLVILFGWYALIFLAVSFLSSLGSVFFFKRKLGGLTGDTLGATNEVCEILFLILFFILIRWV